MLSCDTLRMGGDIIERYIVLLTELAGRAIIVYNIFHCIKMCAIAFHSMSLYVTECNSKLLHNTIFQCMSLCETVS